MDVRLENQLEKPMGKYKKVIIGSMILLCVLLAIYFGVSVYFMNHFYYGTQINGINVSGKSVEEVNKQMAADLQTYALNLKERGGKSEQIKADEAGLKYNSGGDFRSFKDEQNPYKWVSAFFNRSTFKMTDLKYDDEVLKERIDKLFCFDSSSIIEPKDASIKYDGNNYVIIDEVAGNKVDKEILYKNVSEAIVNKKGELDLEAIDCYVKPQITSKTQKLVEAKDELNKYLSSKITYTFGDRKEVLDGSTIKNWITVDESFTVTFDDGKAKDYIYTLSKSYDTVSKARSFASSSGNRIIIGGGDYGWSINKDKETEALIAAIKEGKTIEKQPAYNQTALAYGSNDIGNTYVEVDMTRQHLWFYKNGTLVIQGDVVTGNVSSNNSTPAGVYKLKFKKMNAILTGPDYATPVEYWMPFNNGVGIHDATWRSVFGGDIYKTSGSHGCVNSPYDLAKTIFENIEVGTPVVCYN